ncbi:hypothetical protein [Paenibacillus sp. MMS20-IR301]|uniref:hypothetical protein n=1 Tax=Paenibacillus sp. MMS20-IR301 TaxID=2895946 RepID=UPI0028E5DCA6|nr:hypothetical protein [Paenibacillus sp. MMS20-IR301]WNS44641.1 hypothetical protein LOS79_05030 [Paenibacillus sp. MMS20-IR301]
MQFFKQHRRGAGLTAAAVIASVVLLYALLYMYEKPGGWSDRQMSRSLEMEQTLQIPLGQSPEEAVSLFRKFPFIRLLHEEAVGRGALVFFTRMNQKDGSDLQVEYVRKTWIGWKWVWGGGYAAGEDPRETAMSYMSLPEIDHISTPFPIVFGEVLDPAIEQVVVESKENGRDTYEAKLVREDTGRRLWFAMLPSTATAPFEIGGYNKSGEKIAAATVTDARDFGAIALKK